MVPVPQMQQAKEKDDMNAHPFLFEDSFQAGHALQQRIQYVGSSTTYAQRFRVGAGQEPQPKSDVASGTDTPPRRWNLLAA